MGILSSQYKKKVVKEWLHDSATYAEEIAVRLNKNELEPIRPIDENIPDTEKFVKITFLLDYQKSEEVNTLCQ